MIKIFALTVPNIRSPLPFDEFEQYFDCFVCFLLSVPAGFNNTFHDASFSEGAG